MEVVKMVLLVHGGHRHGYHWEKTVQLRSILFEKGIDIQVIDLSVSSFCSCCGTQQCQDTECVYSEDEFSKKFKKMILDAKVIYFITPTYFNMPPSKLKNFIDRTNALLPIIEKEDIHPAFGAWVSGEADMDSITNHMNQLTGYAGVMGWTVIDKLNFLLVLNEKVESDSVDANMEEIANSIADLIRKNSNM